MLISVSLVPDDVRGLKEDDRALNTVQKLLISTTAGLLCTGDLSSPLDAPNVHGFM